MNPQAQFFQRLKPTIPAFSSLAAEVAAILKISMDSAYRRIRGEKLLDFDEISLLCKEFNISLDEFLCLETDSILFRSTTFIPREDALAHWMDEMLKQLSYINSYPKRHIYFLIKELPPFHHFFHPILASFKFFFWTKSILPPGQNQLEKFCLNSKQVASYEKLSLRILRAYLKVPSTEIWNKDTLNTTLRQIETYHEKGLIEDVKTTKIIYNSLLEVVDHLEKMASDGQKSEIGQIPHADYGEYRLYQNDIISGDNTLLAEIGETKITYLNHSVLYFVGSKDKGFNEEVYGNLKNLIRRSSLVSGTEEKKRTQVFNKLRRKVQAKLEALEN